MSIKSAAAQVIDLLATYEVPFHLRSTVSSKGASRLEDMVRYVHENTRARSIRFEPMAEIGRSCETHQSRPRQQEFVDSFKSAYRLGRSLGIDVTCKMFTNFRRRSTRFCDAEFSVTPSGVVSGCHRYSRDDHNGFGQFKIGSYNEVGFDFDVARINALRAIDNGAFEDCRTCFAKWNCASGCLSARMQPGGISKSGPLCHLTRELLKFGISEQLGRDGESILDDQTEE